MLSEDSRLSLREVSLKLGRAPGTVKKRVTDMQNEGVLKKYTVLLDLTKVGYSQTAVILIQTDGRVDFIKNAISKMPNVISVYHVTGDFDIILTAKFKDNSEVSSFVRQMLKFSSIRRIVPGMALDVIKEDTNALCVT
jgi:DNA-binding Lrp family transcriptional regulator